MSGRDEKPDSKKIPSSAEIQAEMKAALEALEDHVMGEKL